MGEGRRLERPLPLRPIRPMAARAIGHAITTVGSHKMRIVRRLVRGAARCPAQRRVRVPVSSATTHPAGREACQPIEAGAGNQTAHTTGGPADALQQRHPPPRSQKRHPPLSRPHNAPLLGRPKHLATAPKSPNNTPNRPVAFGPSMPLIRGRANGMPAAIRGESRLIAGRTKDRNHVPSLGGLTSRNLRASDPAFA